MQNMGYLRGDGFIMLAELTDHSESYARSFLYAHVLWDSHCILLHLPTMWTRIWVYAIVSEWPGQHGHRLLTENLMVVTAKLILLEAILGCRGFTGGRNNELYKVMASKKKRITVVLQNCSKGLES